MTHCNVSTFLSGSANLAASLSNFSRRWRGKIDSPWKIEPSHRMLRICRGVALSSSLALPVSAPSFLYPPSADNCGARGGARRPIFNAFTFRRPPREVHGEVAQTDEARDICAPDVSGRLVRKPMTKLCHGDREKERALRSISFFRSEWKHLKRPQFRSLLMQLCDFI